MRWRGSVGGRGPRLITANDAEREAADLFLTNNVLRYLNDDEWFDVHPSVAHGRAARDSSRAGLTRDGLDRHLDCFERLRCRSFQFIAVRESALADRLFDAIERSADAALRAGPHREV